MKWAQTAAAETMNMMDVKAQYRGQKSYKTTSVKGISLLSWNDKLLFKKNYVQGPPQTTRSTDQVQSALNRLHFWKQKTNNCTIVPSSWKLYGPKSYAPFVVYFKGLSHYRYNTKYISSPPPLLNTHLI